jgi:hypothetical protein
MEQLQSLAKFSTEQFVKLTHETCDSICGRQGPRHEHYGKLVTIGNWQQFEREFIELVRQSATATEGTKLKLPKNVLGGHEKTFGDCLVARKAEIVDALTISATTVGHSQLKDFDWNLRLILSSDKIAVVSEPVVTVDFEVKPCGEQSKLMSLEMNSDELKTMISSLEAANKIVHQLKT